NLNLVKLLPKFEQMAPKLRHISHNMKYEQGPYLIISLSVGGANAVTLLEPYEQGEECTKAHQIDFPIIIPLFSRTQLGIKNQIDKINQYSADGKLIKDFIMLIYSIANIQNMPYRGYMLSSNLNCNGTHSFDCHYSGKPCKKQLVFRFQGRFE